MSAFVKINRNNYLGLQKHEYKVSRDGFCLMMTASNEGTLLGGEEHGQEIDIFKQPIKAGQTVKLISSTPISPRKYNVLSSVPDDLFGDAAIATGPSIYRAAEGECQPFFVVTFIEDFTLTPEDYMFNFYIID